MATYIYSRVSTQEQNSEQQAQELARKHNHDFIVEEQFTGTTTDRPKFNKLLSQLKPLDTLIVYDVSRIGRNTSEVLEVAERLKNNSVRLLIDSLGGIDVTSSAGEMILTVMAALAKMERSQLRERQAIGIATAKADGKYKGRNATDKGVIDLAKKLLAEEGMTKEKVAKQLNIGVSTLYRLLKG